MILNVMRIFKKMGKHGAILSKDGERNKIKIGIK